MVLLIDRILQTKEKDKMDLKDLEYFKAVCEQTSITKAAHSLYMTPQGLSKIIKNMEAELEAVLLRRTATGITLTESGQYLYAHLPEFLHTYQHICNEIRCIEQRETHEIQLLSAYGILRLVTPECLLAFREKYPHIHVFYREYPDRQVERHFLNGEGNVAFTVGNDALKHVDAVAMEKFEIKLLVHKNHPLAQKKFASIGDLANYPLYIESSEFNISHLIMKKCEQAGIIPNIAFETSGFSLCHKMVAKNKGISVTVDFVFDDMGSDDLVMIPFEDGPYEWETYMLSRKGESPTPDVTLFRNFVLDWMRKIKTGEIAR